MRFLGADGAVVGAGGFLGVAGTVRCRCNGPVRLAGTKAIEVLSADGSAVLRAQLA